MNSAEETELWVAVLASNRAWVERRPADVASLFHADAIAVAPDTERKVVGRDAIVQSYVEFCAAARTHEFKELEHSVHVLGDVAAVSYRFSIRYEIKGKTYDELGHEVLVFTRKGGRWGVAWRTQIPLAR